MRPGVDLTVGILADANQDDISLGRSSRLGLVGCPRGCRHSRQQGQRNQHSSQIRSNHVVGPFDSTPGKGSAIPWQTGGYWSWENLSNLGKEGLSVGKTTKGLISTFVAMIGKSPGI